MYDLTIALHTDSEKCLYEQIYEYIRQEIREGKLLQGERLPSTRSLAEYLQISRSTVDMAYEQLQAEGYIEASPYRGYYVCKLEELFQLGEEVRGKDTADWGENEVKANETEEYLYEFSPTQIDMSCFPFGVWKKLTRNILSDSNAGLFSQGDVQGDYALRATIGRYLHSSRGVNCTPEQIIIGAGNDYLLLLLEKILGRHVHIAMENPTYRRAWQIFQSFAYSITAVDMDEAGMMASKLEREDVTAAYVMPSHQYPTGIVMPVGRRSELLKWADGAKDRYIIEDDYDSEFRYKGKPIPSLQGADRHGKVIYIGTFSKSIAPGIRVSYMVLPEKLLAKYRSECYFYSSTVSRIDQRILEEFIRQGYFERHLNKMRKVYKTKHDLLLGLLEDFREEFDITGENAGLHLLLKAKHSRIESQLVRDAAKQGVRVYGMSDYYVEGKDRAGATIVLGYGGMSEEELRKGIEGLKKAWLL